MTQCSQRAKCLSYIFKWLLIFELVQNTLTFKVNQINQANDSRSSRTVFFWWCCFYIQLMCQDVAMALVLSATLNWWGSKGEGGGFGSISSYEVAHLHRKTGCTDMNTISPPECRQEDVTTATRELLIQSPLTLLSRHSTVLHPIIAQ